MNPLFLLEDKPWRPFPFPSPFPTQERETERSKDQVYSRKCLNQPLLVERKETLSRVMRELKPMNAAAASASNCWRLYMPAFVKTNLNHHRLRSDRPDRSKPMLTC